MLNFPLKHLVILNKAHLNKVREKNWRQTTKKIFFSNNCSCESFLLSASMSEIIQILSFLIFYRNIQFVNIRQSGMVVPEEKNAYA